MKSLIVVLMLALATAASAQVPMPPTTKPGMITNSAGEIIGTATAFGNRIFLRDSKGELFATIQVDKDGTRTMYDPSGKVLDQSTPKAK